MRGLARCPRDLTDDWGQPSLLVKRSGGPGACFPQEPRTSRVVFEVFVVMDNGNEIGRAHSPGVTFPLATRAPSA